MSNRFLIGMALAFALVFIGGIAAVIGINSVTDRVSITDVPADKVVAAPVSTPPPDTAPLPNPAAARPAAPATTGPVTPYVVLDSDLDKLARAVKLGATSTGDVGKDVWAKQVPVAQKLLKGMCDCDQRNWLKHFVQTGEEAVAGSEQYPASVQLLANLRRGNNSLISAQAPR